MEAPIVSSTKLPQAFREKEGSETLVPYLVSPRWLRRLKSHLPWTPCHLPVGPCCFRHTSLLILALLILGPEGSFRR